MDTELFCWKVMHAPLVFLSHALTLILKLMHEGRKLDSLHQK